MTALARRHVAVGWATIAVFAMAGLGLETLHGLKVGWYLDPAAETRREMWRLAHAHGVVIGVLHLGFAFTALHAEDRVHRALAIAGGCLLAGGIAMPVGFVLGGIAVHGGDPGFGIVVVPPGGLLVAIGVALCARLALGRTR